MRHLLFLALTVAGPTLAASFPCEKAATLVEKAICSSNTLSTLDEILADNYSEMLASNIGEDARKHLRSSQRSWLQRRNQCTTNNCIQTFYQEQIDAICAIPVLSGVRPTCISTEEIDFKLNQVNAQSSAPAPSSSKASSQKNQLHILYMAIFNDELQPTNTYNSRDECEVNGQDAVITFQKRFQTIGNIAAAKKVRYKCEAAAP
jgi:uncharacterized protein